MSDLAATTIGSLRRALTARLAAAFADQGREGTAALDARLLLAHAIGIDATRLALHDDEPIDAIAQARATVLAERRIAGEPVARVVGRCAFWGQALAVGPATLVPRPDSETVVEAALAFADRIGGRDQPFRLLDIGTGSGALVLALLSELPAATGLATDLAEGALTVARDNARRLGLAERVSLVACDWATAVRGRFDLVVANPPYVESDELAGLQVEIARHDPHLALDGGDDGLDAYRAILDDLDRLLAAGGRGFLEIGAGQATDVATLVKSQGYSAVFHRDLGGIDRVIELGRRDDHRAGHGAEWAE